MVATENLRDTGVGTGPSAGPASVDKKRVPRLDGIRGFAALGVIVYHVAFITGVSKHISDPGAGIWGVLTEGLSVCLTPFFVLSGLLLYRPFARATLAGTARPKAGPFLGKRALRVLPAYFVMTTVVLLTLNWYDINGFWYVLRPYALVHFFYRGPWITGMEPTWTVPAEVTFYLLLPALAWAIHRYARRAVDPAARARRMVLPIGLFALAGFGWTAFVYLPSMAPSVYYYSFWPFGYVGFFAGGMVLATLSAYAEIAPRPPAFYRLVNRRPNLCWLGALAVYLLYLPKPFGTPEKGDYPALVQQMVDQVLILAFALLVVAPLSVPNLRSRFIDAALANPPVRYLGRVSYGVYLWHVALIHVWFKNGSIFGKHPVNVAFLRGGAGFWELLAFVVAGSVVAASVSYYLVERPLLAYRNRLGSRSGGQAPGAPGRPDERRPGEPVPASAPAVATIAR
jgi:peptidoglycan/LPS O-acetylase OafA/YrhL